MPLEFATLVERYGANIPAGCHIFDHGKEIAFQPVVDVITQVAEQFEKSVLDPEVIKLASAVRDPAIAPDDKFRALLKVKIIEELKKAKPNYSIISEENGIENNKDKNNTWIIDPIDGTINFLHGIPHFAISIALKSNNEIVWTLYLLPATSASLEE